MEMGIHRFGTHLKALRIDRRLTLERVEELTARLGEPVSKTYLSRCEHGEAVPTMPRLRALARVYKVRLGELAERFELDAALAEPREPAPGGLVVPTDPEVAAENCLEAARRDDPQGALVLFDAARRLLPSPRVRTGRVPVRVASSTHAPAPGRASSVEKEVPAPQTTAHNDPAHGKQAVLFSDPARLATARSRLCFAVVASSVGNFRLSKEESEALVCSEDLPDDIRLKASIQLAIAWRRLRRGHLARLVLKELLLQGEALPDRILADSHFLMGCLDLDDAQSRPALLHLRKAVSVYRAVNASADLSRALQYLGEAYRLGGKLPEAIARYKEGLAIARAADLRALCADLLSHLGRAHFDAANNPTAMRYLYESNDLARRGDHFEILFRNYFYIRAINTRQGDEFSRRTAERALHAMLNRCDPLSSEAIRFRREIALRKAGLPGSAGADGATALTGPPSGPVSPHRMPPTAVTKAAAAEPTP